MAEKFVMASMLCLVVAGILLLISWLRRSRKNAMKLVTGGVFLSLVLLYLSYDYNAQERAASVLSSVYKAFQVFFLGREFTDLSNLTTESFLETNIVIFGGVLFVLAPVLTFGNILSLFRNVMDRVHFYTYLGFDMYVLSELNPRSLTLAESIHSKKPFSLIVFAGVTATEEHTYAELIEAARDFGAVCLEKTLPHIRFWIPIQKKHVFLIGEKESDNVACAMELTQKYKNSLQKMSLYIYASSPGVDETLDSMDKGRRLISRRLRRYVNKHKEDILHFEKHLTVLENMPMNGDFSLRCIDPVRQTALDVLVRNFEAIRAAAKESKTVSITILGAGDHGIALLKEAVWIFQLYGCRVECNVIDIAAGMRQRLQRDMPELFSSRPWGDAQHDILLLEGVDCLSATFDERLLQTHWERLRRSQLFFVAMGDDSKNISAALRIRALFQRKAIDAAVSREKIPQDEKEKKELYKKLKMRFDRPAEGEKPLICAVVTDSRRAESFGEKQDFGLRDQNNNTYHIQTVGAVGEVYTYDRVAHIMELEKQAVRHHLLWCLKDIRSQTPHEINGEAFASLKGELEKYVNHSYFRDSSVALALHQQLLRGIRTELDALTDDRAGDVQTLRMVTEHMRWNAYMRSLGYRYHPVRNDRAKQHNLMIPYDRLSKGDREKDLVEYEKI